MFQNHDARAKSRLWRDFFSGILRHLLAPSPFAARVLLRTIRRVQGYASPFTGERAGHRPNHAIFLIFLAAGVSIARPIKLTELPV
jgi:hypothetical protein